MILEDELAAVIVKQGLAQALETLNLPSGTIVTEDQRDTLIVGKKKINIVPFWQWTHA